MKQYIENTSMIKGEIKRTSYNKIEKINLNEQEYQKRLHEIKK